MLGIKFKVSHLLGMCSTTYTNYPAHETFFVGFKVEKYAQHRVIAEGEKQKIFLKIMEITLAFLNFYLVLLVKAYPILKRQGNHCDTSIQDRILRKFLSKE